MFDSNLVENNFFMGTERVGTEEVLTFVCDIVGIDAFVPIKHRYSCAMRTPIESCGPRASFRQCP
jgi:hypothetical protein